MVTQLFMKFTGSGKPKLSHLKWSAENFFNVCTSKLKLVPNHFLRRRTKHTQNLTPWFYIFIFFSHNDTVVDAPKFEIFPHNLSILWVFLNQNLLICSSPTWIFMCKFFFHTRIYCNAVHPFNFWLLLRTILHLAPGKCKLIAIIPVNCLVRLTAIIVFLIFSTFFQK